MMLSILGYATIAIILALLLKQYVAAVIALAVVPILAALVAGNSPLEIAGFIQDGFSGVVGVTAMFVFAILFFGVMRDAGLFDPVINRIVKLAGSAPATVTVATTALAIVAHLDGAGATTFLIAIPAMLPLYERLGMSRLVLTTCVGLGAGVMNLMPWAGPTARAAATINVDANEIWVPLIPAQIAGILMSLGVAYLLGRREARRLERVALGDFSPAPRWFGWSGARGGDAAGIRSRPMATELFTEPTSGGVATDQATLQSTLLRPKLMWVNTILLVATLATLISAVASPAMVFMVAASLALVINYPGLKIQSERFDAHAKGAMLMASTLLAAGVLLGVLEGSGMIDAMATSTALLIPDAIMPALPLIVGIIGVPLSLVFGPDAYYFGFLPVLVGVGDQFGISALHLAQASVIGEETMGFPISPLTGAFYLLVGLGQVDIGRHIRHMIGWAWLVSLGMLAVAIATGVIPLWAA
ncbi:citrate-Mg2+:H+ or citrate-Ca2+:H+ symporter, CitMHS family [Cryobacterium flavum]|uniref:Citrate-Mg2+:H+ or citrate-Ca2+:H+ symporter, CitMHS family n=2 Tax=Cryobacterium flavum TaxID=1424659 RepID=A0A5E9FV01_9MICO|nr:SLC13 family permease [Cryobacterium flavum]SDM69148.1 citrate-Mg2+:H+ or citrate-Ca2+:H+ symporter, CitMHS family [Cryobacterium flavum]